MVTFLDDDTDKPITDIRELSNVSMEERGGTQKQFILMIMFLCLFIIFYIAGGLLGIDRSSEIFIFVSLGLSMVLAAILYRR